MERTVGDPGEFLNNSVASRAVNIEPDMRKVRRLDIYHQKYSKLLRGWGLAGLVLLAIGVTLWYFQHPVWGSLFGVLALPVLFIASRLPQTLKGDAYRNGLLIPGIISNLNPLTITCLADVRTSGDDENDEAEGIVWGVKQVVVPQLTVHPEQLGEQVPCVSLFGETDADGEIYLNFEPRPLVWGTDDNSIIAQARQAIDDEEWELLPPLSVAYASSEKNENGIAYFDAELRPVVLPKPADTTAK
jgi:hypothetical protein